MGERLDSWKEIAAYLGRDVRTLQRWALGRRLPIHHLPGGGERPRVFALASELDDWLRAGGREDHAGRASVAVLPFANLVGPGGVRFGDGLADDIINELVRVPGLRVTARTSSFAFRDAGQDVRRIGARLGVGWLVEGSVRRSGRRVRVSAQLVSARDGFHAWSDTYDRQLTDVFTIQAEIARSVALALELKLAPGRPASRPTHDAVAYELWVKGRSTSQQYTPAALAESRACYEAAIARDPRFARPHFGLAELLFQSMAFGVTACPEDVRRAREALARALELDDSYGDAHALDGVLRGLLDYDWPGAEIAFRRAIDLSPGSANVLLQHAWLHLVPRRRIAEAVEAAEEAATLDPISPQALGRFGLVLTAARQYPRAVDACAAAVRLAPGLWWLRWFYATTLLLQGRREEGFRQARQVYRRAHHPLIVGAMGFMCGLFQPTKTRARQLLRELQETAAHTYVAPLALAFAHLGVGDEAAFDWLNRAIDARDPVVTQLPAMPLYDAIRDDPRFHALLERMKLA